MKEDKSASNKTDGKEVEEVQPVEIVKEEATAESTPEAAEADTTKASFGAKLKAFITPERIVGVIAILLIPCFLTAWVSITAIQKIGVTAEFSMPDALSTATSVVNTLEKAGDAATEAQVMLDQAVDVVEKGSQVLAIVAKALNANSDDYKAALKDAASSLIDDVVDDSKPAASAVKTLANDAAGIAVDKGVDEAASALEGTQAQENLDKAASASAAASEKAEGAEKTAKELQVKAAEAKAKYDSTVAMVKTILSVAKVVWFAFLLLLLVAGILLLVGIKGRYVTGIVAFALSAVASVGSLIGISLANQVALDAVVNAVGAWVLVLVPSLVAPTGWPWFAAVASVAALVALCILLKKHRNKLKAALVVDEAEEAVEVSAKA